MEEDEAVADPSYRESTTIDSWHWERVGCIHEVAVGRVYLLDPLICYPLHDPEQVQVCVEDALMDS